MDKNNVFVCNCMDETQAQKIQSILEKTFGLKSVILSDKLRIDGEYTMIYQIYLPDAEEKEIHNDGKLWFIQVDDYERGRETQIEQSFLYKRINGV